MREINKYLKLDQQEKRLFFEALFFLYRAKIMLFFLPVNKLIGVSVPINKGGLVISEEILFGIKKAVYRADQMSIWRNRCIVKSIAARWMLQRRKIPSTFMFGIKHSTSGKLMAHSWINVNDIEIVSNNQKYKVLTKID